MSLSRSNYLNIPQGHFGFFGVNTGDVIYRTLQSEEMKYELQYDLVNRHVVIIGSSDLSIDALDKILYSKKTSSSYEYWFPEVTKKRDDDGNLLIIFIGFHPHRQKSSRLCKPLYKSPSATPQTPRRLPTSKDVREIQEALSKGVIDALTGIMENTQKELKGVWYPDVLSEHYAENESKMPSEYWSGFADPNYFIKTGRYTFELKEGKSASKAIHALLDGPSVLDCGNATQLAYYKAIMEVIGPEKFDSVFSGGQLNLKITQYGITDLNAPISFFADYTQASKKKLKGRIGDRPVNVGEECHIKGVKWYASKHGNGSSGGFNVVCVGKNEKQEQLFIGHGIVKPKTEKEIKRILFEEYNKERTPEEQEFILNQNSPQFYDRQVNDCLKKFYTIPDELFDKMVHGFVLGSCRGLDAESVLLAKNEESLFKLTQELFSKKIDQLL